MPKNGCPIVAGGQTRRRPIRLRQIQITVGSLRTDRLVAPGALGKLGGEHFVSFACGVGHRSSRGETLFGGTARIETVIGLCTHLIPPQQDKHDQEKVTGKSKSAVNGGNDR